MATQKRNGARKRGSKKKLKFWFLNDELHMTLHINRPGDLITAWSYPRGKRVGYSYSDVLRNHKPGFTTMEVSRMLNRHRVTVENYILNGIIPAPQFTYTLEDRKKHKYMWREEDVLRLHEYVANLHHGNARNDGCITPWPPLPTARELRAMMRDGIVYYVETEDGFKPTWKAEENFV